MSKPSIHDSIIISLLETEPVDTESSVDAMRRDYLVTRVNSFTKINGKMQNFNTKLRDKTRYFLRE